MGDAANIGRRLILKVTVDLETPGSADSSSDADQAQSVGSRPRRSGAPVILVHEGDDAHALAVDFCAEHGLQDDLARGPAWLSFWMCFHVLQPLRCHL
eukprot:Skav225666  [mRNA]  locus=scaffold1924:67324:69485:+ [translate_table: standard]